ncbi:MAG: flagellar biosynthesis protein FlhB [Chloroflexi bacterium]|nr:flagellar biosynthesis protein FlhB [Chloroflexota bacterium]
MSDHTEDPTAKRLGEARERGQIPKSIEINAALMMLGAFWLLRLPLNNTAQSLSDLMRHVFVQLPAGDVALDAQGFFQMVVINTALNLAPFVLGLGVIGMVSTLAQTGGYFNPSLAAPKLDRLNPLSGFKSLFSPQRLVELGKAALKLFIISWAIYSTLSDQWQVLLSLASLSLRDGLTVLVETVFSMGFRVGETYLVFAIADYLYQRRQFTNKLKMTKQEVKEEMKQSEGDPMIRQRILQKGRQMVRQRMMARVPKADVVLINPTHLAVALQYDRRQMGAPKVIAKGALHIAAKIVEIARANGVPVIQNIPLARALYSGVEVDREVPPALYQAVAEVLAFVFSLKKKAQFT